MNTENDHYQTIFLDLFLSDAMLVTSAIYVRRREASVCLIMLSTKQASHWYHYNAFGMARPSIEPTTLDPKADALSLELPRPVYFSGEEAQTHKKN